MKFVFKLLSLALVSLLITGCSTSGNPPELTHTSDKESSVTSAESTPVQTNKYEGVSKFFASSYLEYFEEGDTVNVDLLIDYYRLFEMRDEKGHLLNELLQYKTENKYEICIPKEIVNKKITEHFSVKLDDTQSKYTAPDKPGYYLIEAAARSGNPIRMEYFQENGNYVTGIFYVEGAFTGKVGEKRCICAENPNSSNFRIIYSRRVD